MTSTFTLPRKEKEEDEDEQEQGHDDTARRNSVVEGKESVTAHEILRALLPSCSPSVLAALHREHIWSPADLAMLSKEDLKTLGLTIGERGRVLRWAASGAALSQSPLLAPAQEPSASEIKRVPPAVPMTPVAESPVVHARNPPIFDMKPFCLEDDVEQQHLDEIEQQANFWLRVITESSAAAPAVPTAQLYSDIGDVRERVLEDMFDLTPERVQDVFMEGLSRDEKNSVGLSISEVEHTLRACGCDGLGKHLIAEVVEKIAPNGGGRLQLGEFEATLSRLKLAQLLRGLVGSHLTMPLTVLDYTPSSVNFKSVSDAQALLGFFFGHRPKAVPKPVRWAHLGDGHDPALLLALMVKYSLHPLGVEDVIHQCPTKLERHGNHYMLCIEQLFVAAESTASRGVQVAGRHVTIFCAGLPATDTLITVSQPDRSFAADWPGAKAESGTDTQGDSWVGRLRQRLGHGRHRPGAKQSRLCERRSDFLMYQVVDLCADDLRALTRAFASRLIYLERQLPQYAWDGTVQTDWFFNEVSQSRLQLDVVLRRIRGLRRVIRRASDDADLAASLGGYLQDVADHLDEASEDAKHLAEKCHALTKAYERAVERQQLRSYQEAEDESRIVERRMTLQAEQLNRILFFLTVATTILAPPQFLAGVYGMNFATATGYPTIPELLWRRGYLYFWIFVGSYLLLAICVSVPLFRRFVQVSLPDEPLSDDEDPPVSSDVKRQTSAPLLSKQRETEDTAVRRPQKVVTWIDPRSSSATSDLRYVSPSLS